MKIPFLEQTLRWFGPSDPVPLEHLRQAGATGVVSALHDIPYGEVWPVAAIRQRQLEIERAGLQWSVVESVPVHADIKLGRDRCPERLANYAQTLRNLAACGLQTVCYNFMGLDWTRTDLAWRLPDGAEALRLDVVDLAVFDIHILQRAGAEADHTITAREEAAARFHQMSTPDIDRLSKTILLGFPGTTGRFGLDEFRAAVQPFAALGSAGLRRHHIEFLRHVVPVAEEYGLRLALHPDDPPFPVFGLPRNASTEADLAAILAAVDSAANGLTFCTGSLGAHPGNDLPAMVRRFGPRIHFLHLRNVTREADGSFHEAAHLEGSMDMAAVMEAVIEEMCRRAAGGPAAGLPMRPDHGHRMLDDLGKGGIYPGYSAIGRLRGLAELRGLECGLRRRWRAA